MNMLKNGTSKITLYGRWAEKGMDQVGIYINWSNFTYSPSHQNIQKVGEKLYSFQLSVPNFVLFDAFVSYL